MPTVSNYALARLAGTRHLWDAEFRAQIEAVEKNPADRDALGVLADWLEESDRHEPELAAAARFVYKRCGEDWTGDRVRLVVKKDRSYTHCHFEGVPYDVARRRTDADASTAAGALCHLADQLAEARRELE